MLELVAIGAPVGIGLSWGGIKALGYLTNPPWRLKFTTTRHRYQDGSIYSAVEVRIGRPLKGTWVLVERIKGCDEAFEEKLHQATAEAKGRISALNAHR